MIARWPRLAGARRTPAPRCRRASMAALLATLGEPLLAATLVLARFLWPD
jgi:hypothetical protein